MRPCCVIEQSPVFDQDLRLAQIIEDFTGQKLISELRVKTLAVAILPGTARLDIERPNAQLLEPLAQGSCNKLRAIIRPDMFGWTVFNEELAQGVQHVAGVEFTFNTDGETLARELIDYAEHAEDSTIMCSVLDEVIGPNMAFIGRSETDA